MLRSHPHTRALAIVAMIAALLVVAAAYPHSPGSTGARIRGVVFTGPPSPPLRDSTFAAMADVGATHVALVPEATVYRQSLEIRWDLDRQWYGETTEALLEGIRLARAAGLKVMLKPHLVVGWDLSGWDRPDVDRGDPAARQAYRSSLRQYVATQADRTTVTGSWRGELDVADEADWPRLAAGYRDFLLEHARIAERHGVEMLCIGTELKRLALERPDYWRELVADVREVYSGPLVYAANWDSVFAVEFWDTLDYVGVDAYFPVSDERTPSARSVQAGWQEHARRLAALHARTGKPVLFTEWGYESEDFAGREPWVMGGPQGATGPNPTAQANAYEGTFRALWEEPWLAGVFVWRWAPPAGEPGAYSPRGGEASEVLGRWFGDGRPSGR